MVSVISTPRSNLTVIAIHLFIPMLRSKSFNLYNEENSKQTKQLYQPRRIRWLKFILLPVATSFVIFLVVYNIDFSNESVQTNSTIILNYFDETDVIYFNRISSTESKLRLKCDCQQKFEKIPKNAIAEFGFNSVTHEKCTVIDTLIENDIKIKLLDKIWQCSMTNISSKILKSKPYIAAAQHLRKLRSVSTTSTDPPTTTASPKTTPQQTARTKVSTKTTPSISVNDSTLSKFMVCVSPTKEVISNTSVSYNGHIRIVDYSSTSLQVTLSQVDLESGRLVYFSNYSLVNYKEINEAGESLADTVIELNYLSCNTPFLFCIMGDENKISPFNCQSHQSMACEEWFEGWFAARSSLIIGIAIAGILLSVIFGSLAMYCALRLRPTWLHGSKKLVRLSHNSDTMYLFHENIKNELYGPGK